MDTKLHCPECGGIIGARTVTDEGRPCICFTPPKAHRHHDHGHSTADDVHAPPSSKWGRKKEKTCCVCGKDVAGQKRFRDSRGYWCADCMREDEAKHAVEGERCADCGRTVPAEKLVEYDSLQICSRCLRDRNALHKKKRFRVVSDKWYREHEKIRLMVLFAILGVLLLIIIISRLT
jgi:hypothetical protein